jgi:hypothetical protein
MRNIQHFITITPTEAIGIAIALGVFFLVIVGAVMCYRIVMHGMKSGKEIRMGTWFQWKK